MVRRDTGREEAGGEGEQRPKRAEGPGQAGVLFMLRGQGRGSGDGVTMALIVGGGLQTRGAGRPTERRRSVSAWRGATQLGGARG